jgi:hypothetical protein
MVSLNNGPSAEGCEYSINITPLPTPRNDNHYSITSLGMAVQNKFTANSM